MSDCEINGSSVVQLSHGKLALIDQADMEMVSQYTWYLNQKGYATTTKTIDGVRSHIRMHRLIMGLSNGDGKQVDHANGDAPTTDDAI